MFKSLRSALVGIGGLQAVLALGAIGWGLHTLQKVVEERQAHLDALAEAIAEADQRRWHAEEEAKAAQSAPGVPDGVPSSFAGFGREDVDPLGKGEPE